jgi:hypothetical protein
MYIYSKIHLASQFYLKAEVYCWQGIEDGSKAMNNSDKNSGEM